jgi:nucleotide-binding universal stress UspA family protein
MFDNVVAGVLTGVLDDQTDRDVIALAQELVSPQGKLTLLHLHLVTPKPAHDSGSLADTAKCRQALQRLAALADELSADAEVHCVEAHSPRRGLHEFASRRGADLVVVRASRGDENDRTFLDDDTRKVLEDAPCAVAVAPPEFAARAGALKKIGVGFDGSAALVTSALTPADPDAVRDVAWDRTPAATVVAHLFSWIGSGFVVLPVALACCVSLYRRRRRAAALAVVLSTVGVQVITDVDKLLGAVLGASWSAVASRLGHLWNSADQRSKNPVGPQEAAWAR